MFAQRADDVFREFVAFVDVAADFADKAFLSFGLRFWFDVVLVVGVGHGLLVAHDTGFGDTANEHAMGSEVNILLYLEGHECVDVFVQEYKSVAGTVDFLAGRMAGEYFAKNMLNLDQPMDQFVSELQNKMKELKMGVLRIEDVDEESGKIILTVAEDADCSGLPVLGETVCNYDEGFIAGILSVYSGKQYTAIEVDCWAKGDRVCRFHANVEE